MKKPKLPKEQVDYYKSIGKWPPPKELTIFPWDKAHKEGCKVGEVLLKISKQVDTQPIKE